MNSLHHRYFRMPPSAADAMEGVVAALNRLPLNLVPFEWVEQVLSHEEDQG